MSEKDTFLKKTETGAKLFFSDCSINDSFENFLSLSMGLNYLLAFYVSNSDNCPISEDLNGISSVAWFYKNLNDSILKALTTETEK